MIGRGWRPALRIARRDLRRSPGRNLLVVLMVGLPVLAVSTFATVYETDSLSRTELLASQLAGTQAQVTVVQTGPIDQEPDTGAWAPVSGSDAATPELSAQQVASLIGRPVLDVAQWPGSLRTKAGALRVRFVAADLTSADLAGYAQLRSGRLPRTADEVVVSPWLASHGHGVGQRLDVEGGRPAAVVGVAYLPNVYADAAVVARPGSAVLPAATDQAEHTFLVPGTSPVSWSDVRAWNQHGLAVLSRQVAEHPPADWRSDLSDPDSVGYTSSNNAAERAVLVLVVFSIVLEVVLLAGPAFAVGVRRQRRQLALVAATGGTGRDVRRVVLAQAVTTGVVASAAGAALGLPIAAFVVWWLPRVRPETTFGPFDVAWLAMAVAAGLGAVAALTAAWFPSRAAARQDVVAVLAGRRGQLRSRRGLPVLGLALLVIGAGVSLVRGTKPGGEFFVAGGTLLMVLGAIALVPTLVGGVGRLGGPMPLPLRLATRDSARQRGRTAPAVAAVMAAVAGVTTLAIGASSDFAQSRAQYQPQQAMGVTTISAWQQDEQWWAATSRTVAQLFPDRALLATGQLGPATDGDGAAEVYVPPPGCPTVPRLGVEDADERCTTWQLGGAPASEQGIASMSSLVAGPAALSALGYHLSGEQRSVLERGGVLLPSPGLVDASGHATLTTYVGDYTGDRPRLSRVHTERLPAAAVTPPVRTQPVTVVDAIMTPATAQALEVGWHQVGAVLSGPTTLDRDAQDHLEEVLQGTTQDVSVYTERGFDESFALPLVGLLLIAAVAVLVGTLSATGLALVDSRPDAATLAAVGARPRTRRAMAASQAVVIGLLGSLTGIAVGFVPGLAVAWPLTAGDSNGGGWGSPTIDVPWVLLLTVGLAVPVLAAAAAGLGVRSRLPLTRRLGQ